ncbi:MAG: site-specific integrase, partial [Anaerolineales bacterium]|nr:site-specific integrase [Anaerolineales bacterium]
KGLILVEPKSAAGKRLIVLSSATVKVLRNHMNIQQEEKLIAGENWQENDLVFPSTLGTPLDPSNMSRDFKNTLKMAGLPNIRFHDLRHTAATLMLQQGTHPKIVQERLGHSDVSLTLNTYSHVLPSLQEDAAEKMDEILVPIEVSDELKKLSEPTPNFVVSGHE